MTFADIVMNGAGVGCKTSNIIRCADGFKMSVIANPSAFCSPLGELADSAYFLHGGVGWTPPEAGYAAVEVGFPSERPEPWDTWSEYAENPDIPEDTIYRWVPVATVQALIDSHGGEK